MTWAIDLLRFVKPLERNKSFGCTIKKENSLYQTYVPMIFCPCFLLYSFLYCRYNYSIHSIYNLFSSHSFLTTDHLTYICYSSRFGAKKETEWPPKGSKQRNRQFFLHPQGCCIVGEDILLTVLSPRSFSLTLLRQM